MQSAGTWLAIILGGVAIDASFGACGGTSNTPGFGDDAGTSSGGSGSSSGTTSSGSGSSSGTSSSSSGSSSGTSSSSSGSSSGGSSSSSGSSSGGSSSGASGYAIPLTSPGGADFEYTAQTTVGGQVFALSIDTGSTTLGVAGSTCSGCGVTPLYTPSSSAKATGQTGQSQYIDGSGWSGPIYTDTVSLGNGSPSVPLDIVDITSQQMFFQGGNTEQGILGLGPNLNAVPGTDGYIPTVMGAGVAQIFALQLCDGMGADQGTMWLGGAGPSGAALVYTPLIPIGGQNAFYAINVDGMSLGGTSVVSNAAATFAEPVLDTGTSLFYVPTSVFQSFQTTLAASSGFQAVFGSTAFDGNGCVSSSSATDAAVEAMLPTLSLSLPAMGGGSDVTIQASSLDTYLSPAGGGQYCLMIQDGGTQDPSTFGDAFLQAFLTVIDLQGGRVGFAKTGCATPQIWHARHLTEKAPHRGPRPGHR